MSNNKKYPTIEIYSAHAGGAYWKNLTDRLAAKGFKIEEHYGVSDAQYRSTKSKWGKLWLRWKMYALYPLSLVKLAFSHPRSQPTLRLAITTPFFLPALMRILSRKKIPTINLINDVFPEALVCSGMLKTNGFASGILERITQFAIRKCSASVFIGTEVKRFCEINYGRSPLSKVIPVGSDETWFPQAPKRSSNTNNRPTVLYSGAMGHMHEINTLVYFLRTDFTQCIRLRIHSFGIGYDRLKQQLESHTTIDDRIILAGGLKHTDWQRIMQSAEISLITLKNGAEHVSFPSKTFSALMAGQAIIAICSKGSDLATVVQHHDCGWVIEPNDHEGLKQTFEEISSSPENVLRKRLNAYKTGHELYSLDVVERQWIELFQELHQIQTKK